jgi:uroporphyrinogen III methyltransferase/synthase
MPEARPLEGVRVVLTRAPHQAGPWVEVFAAAGARTELLPLLEVVPVAGEAVERALAEARTFDAWIFTSTNAVDALFNRLPAGPPPPLVAAVGPATAAALEDRGVSPDLVARKRRAGGLLEELGPRLSPGARLLLPQAEDARPELAQGLRRGGHEVGAVVIYRKILPPDAGVRAGALFGADALGWVTFTSPRIVRHFAGLFGEAWGARRAGLRAASIGPVTSGELRRFGVEPAAEGKEPTPRSLVEAMAGALGQRTGISGRS